MGKIDEARKFLIDIGMPKAQQSDLCCFVVLAMATIGEFDNWKDAKNNWLRIHDIIQFTSNNYEIIYAENSRETFRKSALHPFRTAALVEDNGKATNSPNYMYRLTEETLNLIKHISSKEWDNAKEDFLQHHDKLVDIYKSKKEMRMLPVKINNIEYTFSPGKHNDLQKSIITEFAPRFAPNSECLYVGDTVKKDLFKNEEKLKELGFKITLHDKMPDVVLYRKDKDWIYFIEAVTSVGPIDSKRVIEIEEMTQDVKSGCIYVTSFLDFKTYKKFSAELAWETEVWIAELPEHMIHLNGDMFMGPR